LFHSGVEVIQGLEEFRETAALFKGIVQQCFFLAQEVAKNRGDKFPAEENGENPNLSGAIDAAGVFLVVVENEEFPGSHGQLPVVHTIPFLAAEHRFYGKTTYMTRTMAPARERVEDDIVLPEFAEMQALIKPRFTIVRQRCKIHESKLRVFAVLQFSRF